MDIIRSIHSSILQDGTSYNAIFRAWTDSTYSIEYYTITAEDEIINRKSIENVTFKEWEKAIIDFQFLMIHGI